MLLELICLQCRNIPDQNVDVDQEHVEPGNLIDEVNGRNHVDNEEQGGTMQKYDHQGSHEEDGDRNNMEGDDNNLKEEDRNNKMDHHVDGGLPVISDSVFSIIIMVCICIVIHAFYQLPDKR